MRLVLAVLAAALASCEGCPDIGMQKICVRVEDPRADALRISFCGKEPRLNDIKLRRRPDDETIWRLVPSFRPDGDRPRLRDLTYGVVPSGWDESGPRPPPLTAGDRITISVWGPGSNGWIEVTVE
jgi:hypothetical protein